jgi:hypothetical protein
MGKNKWCQGYDAQEAVLKYFKLLLFPGDEKSK